MSVEVNTLYNINNDNQNLKMKKKYILMQNYTKILCHLTIIAKS